MKWVMLMPIFFKNVQWPLTLYNGGGISFKLLLFSIYISILVVLRIGNLCKLFILTLCLKCDSWSPPPQWKHIAMRGIFKLHRQLIRLRSCRFRLRKCFYTYIYINIWVDQTLVAKKLHCHWWLVHSHFSKYLILSKDLVDECWFETL